MKNKKQMKKNKRKRNKTLANQNVPMKESRAAAVDAQKKANKPVAANGQKKQDKPAAANAQKKQDKPAAVDGQKKANKPAAANGQKKQDKPVAVDGQKKANKPVAANSQKKQDKPAVVDAQKKANKLAAADCRKEGNKSATANRQKKTDQSVGVEGTGKGDKRIESGQSVEDNAARKQKRGRRQKEGTWKEVIYNCPYLIAVLTTSLVVMICSEKIGIRAVAAETKTAVQQTMNSGTHAKRSTADSEADKDVSNLENRKKSENSEVNDADADQNAGECKEDADDKELTSDDLNNNGDAKKVENSKENKTGITRFEYYEPQEVESRYYSDAGKVAMTTDYHYTKENISYFSDAAFLGDSRTLGISDYAGLDEADFYCDSGMMIFKLLEEEGVTYQKTGDKVNLTQVLQEKQYGKIYIMLGMNELGYGNTDTYLEQYRKVVNQIREWQPDAIIYIMANLHVSREKNNLESEFNNININDKNAAAALLANGTDVFYLDANPLFTDEEGFLNAELTFDGVHLYAQHYDLWREFLLEHAVEPKDGQTDGENQVSDKVEQPEGER